MVILVLLCTFWLWMEPVHVLCGYHFLLHNCASKLFSHVFYILWEVILQISMWVDMQRAMLFILSAIHCPNRSSDILEIVFPWTITWISVEKSNYINNVLGCFLFLCSCILYMTNKTCQWYFSASIVILSKLHQLTLVSLPLFIIISPKKQ
jgi:hypothetical protein